MIAKRYKTIYGDGADFVVNPELMEKFPYTVRSAVCYWIENKLDKLADKGDKPENVDAITAVINKSTDSYGNRRGNFVLTYATFK